jgi:cytosine deaminase
MLNYALSNMEQKLPAEIVVKNARVRGLDGLYSIKIDDGEVEKISRGDESGERVIDAKGMLATESFVIAHLHLDKVNTGGLVAEEALKLYQESFMDTKRAIELASKIKERYDTREIVERVRKTLNEAIRYGVTHMRGFADTDTKGKLEGVKALLQLREEFRGKLDLQVVAFPQEGIETDPGAEDYVEKAVEMGADVVGGIPWLELTEEDQKSHIDKMFAIAKKHDKPVAMLVDDAGDPGLQTLQMLALKALKERWIGRVQACHARAMQLYPEPLVRKVAALCAKADVGVVTDPQTGPLHARVDELVKAGVTVALGQDDCYDAYYPYGRCKMMEVAYLGSHLLRMMGPRDMGALYDMVTVNPAKIIGLKDFRLAEGSPANLVVLQAKSLHEAFTYQADPAYVISQGKLVYELEREPPG